jgi:hypothetical protein
MKKFLWNTTALYAPVDAATAAARQAQRESIPVVSSTKEEEKEPPKAEGEEGAEAGEGEGTEGTEGTEGNEGGESESEGDGGEGQQDQNEEQIAANAEAAAKLEQEKKDATSQKEKDRIQRRIDRLTAKSSALEKENAELKAKLAAKPDKVLSEEEVETRANTKAQQISNEREFTNACNRLAEAATKVDKEFKKKIDSVVDELGGLQSGGMPPHMIHILDDMDNGGEVLSHLANDIDTYEEVITLPMGKMASRLAKIATKIEEDKKAATKKPPIKDPSKVPNPPEQLRGGKQPVVAYNPKMSMNDYAAMRLKQKQQREERRKAGMR